MGDYLKEAYVLIYHSAPEPDRLLKSMDALDGAEVLPGFALAIIELSQKLVF
jgi:hypothetical protein